MRDLIDPEVLRHAVDTTMKRYPYFCVELQKKDGELKRNVNVLKRNGCDL